MTKRTGLALVRLDHALLAMIRDAWDTVKLVLGVFGLRDPSDVPTWDHPWDPRWYRDVEGGALLAQAMGQPMACHAIGFLSGCAAMLDMTPGEMIDLLDD